MKRYLFAALLMAAPTLVFAQLKVSSNGSVEIGVGNTSSFFDGKLSSKRTDSNGYICSAICGHMLTTGDPYTTTGLMGICNTNEISGGRNFGVYGLSGNVTNGAAIYGSPYFVGASVTGNYAGYFDGNVKVNGNLNAYTVTTLSDMRLKENVMPLTKIVSSGTTLQNLMSLNVIKYNLSMSREIAQIDKAAKEMNLSDKDITLAKKDLIAKQSQKHYGLSAQELQELYPELVTEGQDGYLTVNYIELVPILIQSIQELKQELDAVKGGAELKTRSVNDETADFAAVATGNVLYQNTPNPFKEQTTIRFRLAEDATNAAICIFDMSGKMLKKLPVSRGMTSVTINGYDLDEGLYLYSLVVNGMEIDTKRMVLSK